MANIIVELSKYILVVCIILYTYQCFSVFGYHDYDKKQRILNRQRNLMLVIHFICFLVIYTSTNELNMLIFYAVQGVILIVINLLYTFVYPKVSRLVVNNMCMLISIGFVMLARLSFNKAVKQCVFVSGCFAASLFVPLIIRKVKMLSQWRIFYGVVGIVSLAAVLVAAQVSDGAKLGFTFGGISIQPSELVKIIFVFFVAGSFYKRRNNNRIGRLSCIDLSNIKRFRRGAYHFCCIFDHALCGNQTAFVYACRVRRRKRGFRSGISSVFTCAHTCIGVEGSVCGLSKWWISGSAVFVCDRHRQLVRNGTFPGSAK